MLIVVGVDCGDAAVVVIVGFGFSVTVGSYAGEGGGVACVFGGGVAASVVIEMMIIILSIKI